MYQSELDIQYARQRYQDELAAARLRRLSRTAQRARRSMARPTPGESLIARMFEALRLRRAVRA